MAKLKLGIIGSGFVAHFHVRALQQVRSVVEERPPGHRVREELSVVVEPDERLRRERTPAEEAETDVLDDRVIDEYREQHERRRDPQELGPSADPGRSRHHAIYTAEVRGGRRARRLPPADWV